jgi:hypothetical protein
MSDLRQAAQQALEAWEHINKYGFVLADYEGPMEQAITALKAALEQPNRAQKMRDAGYTRRPTLREMAEPVQEPVAWACFKNGELQTELVGTEADVDFWCASDEPEIQGMVKGALYTHPPRRETEQEPNHKPDCALLRIPSRDCDCGAEPEPAK